jgi:hypothetical protein
VPYTSTSGPPLDLVTIDSTILKGVAGGRVEAVGAGASAVLFMGPDQNVVDFIHLWVSKAEELRIQRYSSAGVLLGQVLPSVTLLTGDELLVAVEPYAKGQALLGNFELTRETVGDAIAIVPDSVAGWYRVVARKAGSSTVEFQALGIKKSWQIEVVQ